MTTQQEVNRLRQDVDAAKTLLRGVLELLVYDEKNRRYVAEEWEVALTDNTRVRDLYWLVKKGVDL